MYWLLQTTPTPVNALIWGVLFLTIVSSTAGQETQSLPPQQAESQSTNGPLPPTALELPTAETIQQQIDSVTADENIDEAMKSRLLATLRSTAESLRTLRTERDRKSTLDASIESVPKRLDEIQSELATDMQPLQLPEEVTDPVTPLPLESLRKRRNEAEATLNIARQNRQLLEDTQRDRLNRSTNLPMLIEQARAAATEVAAATIGELADDPQGTLLAARENGRLVAIAAARQRLDTLLAEQAMINAESDLLPLQIEVANKKVLHAETMLKLWTDLLGRQKQFRIESDLANFKQISQAEDVDINATLLWPLSDRWVEMIRSQAEIQRAIADTRTRIDDLDAIYREVSTEIERDLASSEGLRSGLGLKLLRILTRMTPPSQLRNEIRAVDEQIENSRQFQTEIDLAIESIGAQGSGRVLNSPMLTQPARSTLNSLQQNLLINAMTDTDDHLNGLIELKSVLELKRRKSIELREKIEANVIWIRDATTFRLSNVPAAWTSLQSIFSAQTIRPAAHSLIEAIPRRLDLCLIWVLSAAFPWALTIRLRKRLQTLNRLAKLPVQCSIWSTVSAIFITFVQSLPPVVTLAIAGTLISDSVDESPILNAIGTALQVAALLMLPMLWLKRLLPAEGVLQTHFDYHPKKTEPARRALKRMIWSGAPLSMLWVLASSNSISQGELTLARLVFVIGMVALAIIFWKALDPKTGVPSHFLSEHPNGWLARLRWLWHGLTLSPIIIALLSLVGYTYAATLLSQRLYWSFWFVVALVIVGGTLKRWVRVRRTSRLYEAQSAQASIALSGDTSSDVAPLVPSAERLQDREASFAEIDAQTLRLLGALLWVSILVGVAWLWAPVLPAVRYLERIPLWDTTGVDGAVITITLANLVVALPIVFLTWVSARNVPGLIETILLERLPLDKPARYAITSLASYAIVILGIIFSAQAIGLRWEGIQWLVAALGVGLGFGLQEIFANFISGLILLFEQPIRVGDVVTIGNTSGSVSKIRMRATVVTNWDRQELIIPNKMLITERLINWTLTDTTNRLEIQVGVAYETDTRVACRLLEEICAQHEYVLVDPKPLVTFEGFGDSTLKLVIRCFLARLDQRLTTIHELHTTINERFKQAGIEIAFPQQDLHIRSLPPTWHHDATPSETELRETLSSLSADQVSPTKDQ